MGRQLTFDRDEKLKQAMGLFWAKGYEATSLQDLVNTLEINRFSLYNTFGDKRTLFRQTLERYKKSVLQRLIEPLVAPDAGLAAIHAYLDNLSRGLAQASGDSGCFFQNTVAECGPEDDDIRSQVEETFMQLETLLEQALQRAKTRGELKHLQDPQQGARFLVTHIQGVILLRKATRDSNRVQDSLRFLQAQLQAW